MSLNEGIGYSGKSSIRAWVAEIVGTSDRYSLSRDFLDADDIERDHFGRSRYIRTYHFELEPGLYETFERGEREYRIVWLKNGRAVQRRISTVRATAIARLLDDNEEFESARLGTK